MSASSSIYKLLRVVRIATAVKKGRVGSYAKRSLIATLVGKTTGRWGR